MFYISTVVLSLLFTFKKMYLSNRYLLVHRQTFSPVKFLEGQVSRMDFTESYSFLKIQFRWIHNVTFFMDHHTSCSR